MSPLPLRPTLVGMGASEFPAGWGVPCVESMAPPAFHTLLTAQTKSDLCRNLISFIKLQITQGQLHLCFFHSVKLRILYVEGGQGMPAKRALKINFRQQRQHLLQPSRESDC